MAQIQQTIAINPSFATVLRTARRQLILKPSAACQQPLACSTSWQTHDPHNKHPRPQGHGESSALPSGLQGPQCRACRHVRPPKQVHARQSVACGAMDSRRQSIPPAFQESGNGVYLLMLINVVIFLVDHALHVPFMQALYLNHSYPQAWQWLSHMFCHANWGHISNNLFLLLTFGRLVEELEGPWGVTFVYVLCGLGAALASFLLSPRASVSLGASGAIFGLFAVSVLSRLSSFSPRRLLESVVLGQFVVRQVWTEMTQQLAGGLVVGGLHVSHLAHLGGAMAGVCLVLMLQRVPKGEGEN